jgi:hypothetical protein
MLGNMYGFCLGLVDEIESGKNAKKNQRSKTGHFF